MRPSLVLTLALAAAALCQTEARRLAREPDPVCRKYGASTPRYVACSAVVVLARSGERRAYIPLTSGCNNMRPRRNRRI